MAKFFGLREANRQLALLSVRRYPETLYERGRLEVLLADLRKLVNRIENSLK
jgi:hypothetical protein